MWTLGLDEAWSVEAVREASYKALAEVGKDSMHFRPPEEQNAHKVRLWFEHVGRRGWLLSVD